MYITRTCYHDVMVTFGRSSCLVYSSSLIAVTKIDVFRGPQCNISTQERKSRTKMTLSCLSAQPMITVQAHGRSTGAVLVTQERAVRIGKIK